MEQGKDFAGYRIEAEAGKGGMGVVYRATQLALDRTVALKLIAQHVAGDDAFRERFQRESRLLASIDHPNVITVLEAGEASGQLFISMRWVDGTDLRGLVSANGSLDPGRAAAIVTQVGAALDAAHGRGLVHRDVKDSSLTRFDTRSGRRIGGPIDIGRNSAQLAASGGVVWVSGARDLIRVQP